MKPETQAACEAAKQSLAIAISLIKAEAEASVIINDPPDLVRFYADMCEEAEAMRDRVKELSKLEQSLAYNKIPECFDAAGIKNINVVGYGRVSLGHRYSCKILDKEKGFMWLRANGQGGMIIETVNAQTLGAWAGKEIEDSGREPPQEVFETKMARYVSLTRSK